MKSIKTPNEEEDDDKEEGDEDTKQKTSKQKVNLICYLIWI